MKNIIRCENIVKTFGEGDQQCRTLDGVSAQIGDGEFVAVMGPSGSGKSTLLFALSGMDTTSKGSVYFLGRDLSELKENELADMRRRQMGFIFQQPTLLRNLNILDNIVLPSLRDNRGNATGITRKAQDLMRKTGIAGLEKRDVTQVSGGQLQRAGICRALMSTPEIIFGDEPTGALNSKAAEDIMDIVSEINAGGTAVMLVTHDARVAARAGRVLFMQDGKILSEFQLTKFRKEDLDSRTQKVSDRMREMAI
jgi:putative ABC transport system ATP-binding protein